MLAAACAKEYNRATLRRIGVVTVRKLGILIGLMAVLIICGSLSAGLLSDPLSGLLIKQTSSPDASTFAASPVQSFQLIAWIGFVLINMLGAGLTIAAFFWLMNRALAGVRRNAPAAPAAAVTAEE
jgi:hypothetical protein